MWPKLEKTLFNKIFSLREQDEWIYANLKQRLEDILPVAMREAGLDMWVILCQEDNPDPVFQTMIPMNCWTPILQMLVFFDRGPKDGIERINISMTDTADLYDTPWKGRSLEEQWGVLAQIIKERNPRQIGVNTGRIQWAAGGLTYNLYQQFQESIASEFRERVVSAEAACTRWLMTFSKMEKEIYPHVISIAHQVIAHCFSRATIVPGVTTTTDLEWAYWQTVKDLGLETSFKPYFRLMRSQKDAEKHLVEDKVIRMGDFLHCDVGLHYLRLCSDHQELAYVLRETETDAPAGLKNILAQNNRLQKVYLSGFEQGLTGDQLLQRMLEKANQEGIPAPKIYSHSLGLFLHEPGPLIGLPWEQKSNPGRGEVKLEYDTCFTMELSIEEKVPEWGNQLLRAGAEQDVMFTDAGCHAVDGVQTRLHLI
jgi:hypothetical protein